MAEPTTTAALATRITSLQTELSELTSGARKLKDNSTAGRAAGELSTMLAGSRKTWEVGNPVVATLKSRL